MNDTGSLFRQLKDQVIHPRTLLLILFILISGILILHHEPYEDEAQAWMIARSSPDIPALLGFIGNEGTPALWHLVLFGLSHSGLPYLSMAVVHSLIITGALFLFLRYSPFSSLQKIFFSFGYFILYEYNIIARNYALSILFLFLIAAMYRERYSQPIRYSLLIVLLANTNVHSLIISLILIVFYWFERKPEPRERIQEFVVPVAVMVSGILLAVYQLLPPPELTPQYAGWDFTLTLWHFGVPFRAFCDAFLPVPQMMISFWNSRLVPWPTVAGLLVFLISLLFFARKPRLLLLYLSLAGGISALFFFKHTDIIRHHGLIFILFVFCLWVSGEYGSRDGRCPALLESLTSPRALSLALTLLLGIHLLGTPVAVYYEFRYPFSGGHAVAEFLKNRGISIDNTFIAAYPSEAAVAILPYLPGQQAQVYCIEYGEYCRYGIWNLAYDESRRFSDEDILRRFDEGMTRSPRENGLLILNRDLPLEEVKRHRLVPCMVVKETIVMYESFSLYRSEDSTGLHCPGAG